MTRKELAERLRRETDGVAAPPALVQRTLRAAYETTDGKEENKPVMKKISLAVALALLAVTLCAAAIAAANRWGMLDFVDRYAVAHYIPQDAQDYVRADVATMENERAVVTVRELYYDGRTARMTVDVTPKDEHVLVVGEDVCLSDPFINLTQSYVVDSENDLRSVYQIMQEEGIEQVFAADFAILDAEHGITGGSMDYVLGGDGTLTIFHQEEFAENRPQREVTLQAILMPYSAPLTPESCADYNRRETLETTLTLTASVSPTDVPEQAGVIPNVYVSKTPVDYPSVGVCIDRLTIEVKPQDLYAIVAYTVTDAEAFAKTEDGLWFEFIDPDKAKEPPADGQYADQRLTAGLSGGGMAMPVDAQKLTYRQTETLGRNELRDAYVLRAFSCWDKARFEAHTLEMRPATTEDMRDTGDAESPARNEAP